MHRFPIPSPRLKFDRMNEDTLLQTKKLFNSFPIHSINLLLPSSSSHKEELEDLISDENIYFIVKDVTAKCFIQMEFLEHFVKSGSLLVTSLDARVEVENFLSVVPPGKLVLSLEKGISWSLALHKESYSKKRKGRQNFETIIIDLMCPELRPGKKLYEFISCELSKIEHINFNLLLKWKPSGNVCPQSIKAYFASQNIECVACKPNHMYSSKSSIPMPTLRYDLFDSTSIEDIVEWISTQICGIHYSTVEDEYVSKFFVPESSEILNKLHKCSFEGFYSESEVLPIIKKFRTIFETDSTLSFIVLCLSGFQDSFVAANGFQYFSSADKLIFIVAFPSSSYFLITLNAR